MAGTGSILNYLDLKLLLSEEGSQIAEQGDLYTALALIRQNGIEVIKYFRGAFSLAIWQRKKNWLILCRDRWGRCPLFWNKQGNKHYFASTIKSLCILSNTEPNLNITALDIFFRIGWTPKSYCLMDEIKSINYLATPYF